MRCAIALMGLVIGLAANTANAQLVYRDEVTTSRLTERADLVALARVDSIETIGQDEHQGLLVHLEALDVLKGPDSPGRLIVFTFLNSSGTIPFEEGEEPLLFLNGLAKEDLKCAKCGSKGPDVLRLPDGNYFLVQGGKWGKILPGLDYVDTVAEDLRLRQKQDYPGLKSLLMDGTRSNDERIALDSVIDLVKEEKAREALTPADSAAIVGLLQNESERFRPLDPLVALAGYTGLPEALDPVIVVARADAPRAEPTVIAKALSLLTKAGVEVASTLRADLESPDTPEEIKGRFIQLVAKMGEQDLTDSVVTLTQSASLRKIALIALGDLKDEKGLPTLVAALEQGEMRDREAAAVALAYFGPKGVEVLKEYESSHPDDDLARFIHDLRRNPRRVRGRVEQG